MFYANNMPRWERIARLLAAAGAVAYGLLGFNGSLVGYLIVATGAATALTGFFGYCPMCALAGRRFKG